MMLTNMGGGGMQVYVAEGVDQTRRRPLRFCSIRYAHRGQYISKSMPCPCRYTKRQSRFAALVIRAFSPQNFDAPHSRLAQGDNRAHGCDDMLSIGSALHKTALPFLEPWVCFFRLSLRGIPKPTSTRHLERVFRGMRRKTSRNFCRLNPQDLACAKTAGR
jgi:hypothetical protein